MKGSGDSFDQATLILHIIEQRKKIIKHNDL